MSEYTQTDLSRKIAERCNQDGLPPDHKLREVAKAFDEAAAGFYASPQTVDVKTFMRAWARCRIAWCDYSGEGIV
jgi:hypothetical protein